MANQFEDFEKISKEQMAQFSSTAASIARGFQAIASGEASVARRLEEAAHLARSQTKKKVNETSATAIEGGGNAEVSAHPVHQSDPLKDLRVLAEKMDRVLADASICAEDARLFLNSRGVFVSNEL